MMAVLIMLMIMARLRKVVIKWVECGIKIDGDTIYNCQDNICSVSMLTKLNLVLKTKVIKMVKNSWPIKDKCLQNGGAGCFTVDQQQCVFPFQYKGMQYTQCTTVSQNCNLCPHKLIWWQKIRSPMLLVWGPWHNNANALCQVPHTPVCHRIEHQISKSFLSHQILLGWQQRQTLVQHKNWSSGESNQIKSQSQPSCLISPSTSHNDQGEHVKGEWGDCDDSCPVQCKTIGGPKSGQSCVFPFRCPWKAVTQKKLYMRRLF